ncbi:MAG: glutaredoxin domain-containing protein [Patescibacteria group bacterium]
MENTSSGHSVTIYSTPTCGYCKLAKAFFKENGVEYVEHDVSEDLKAQEEMIAKTNQMGVPVIDIDGEIIIGFDQERLSELLGVK